MWAITKTRIEARIEILEADGKETKKQMVEINSSLVLVIQQLKEVQHGFPVLSTQMNNIPHLVESSSTRFRIANLIDSFKGAYQEPEVKEVERGWEKERHPRKL